MSLVQHISVSLFCFCFYLRQFPVTLDLLMCYGSIEMLHYCFFNKSIGDNRRYLVFHTHTKNFLK